MSEPYVEKLRHALSHKRNERLLVIGLALLSLFVYTVNLGALPLTDYDEATYAQVTRDSMAAGDLLTLRWFDRTWFEKPPLYFWLAAGSSSVLGETETAYRLPSALLGVLGVVLLYLLIRKITGDPISASIGAVTLLAMPFYVIAARQVRLDIPAITAILASLTAFAYGWHSKQWMIAVAPAIAVAFMFKSVVALFAVPAIFALSFFFKEWEWLKQKWFWIGVFISIAIVIPWHAYEYAVWGDAFTKEYLGKHVFERLGSGLTQEHNPRDPIGYLQLLWIHGQPWITAWLVLAVVGTIQFFKSEHKRRVKLHLASLVSLLIIFIIVASGRTQILTYTLPLFPFMAITIGVLTSRVLDQFKQRWAQAIVVIGMAVLLIFSYRLASAQIPTIFNEMHFPFNEEERQVGLIVGEDPDAHLYVIEWPFHETLRFYGRTDVQMLPFPPESEVVLEGPWYLLFTNLHVPYFIDESGETVPEFADKELLYDSGKVFLIHGQDDLTLP